MSTIQTQIGIVHLESGLNSSSAFQRTANESAFTSLAITVNNTDELLDYGDVITPQQVFLKLVSGSDLKIGFSDSDYPMRLSGVGDVTNLRLNVEGNQEQSQVVAIADSNSDLSGKYFDLYDRNGPVRVWFQMGSTTASGIITFGVPSVAVAATGTLTVTANPTDGETVTIGGTTYRFKNTVSVANDVKIGNNAADSINNLLDAIAGSGDEGITYGTGTVKNTSAKVVDHLITDLTLKLEAEVAGYSAIATTETLVNGSFGAETLTGGLNSTSVNVNGTTFSYVNSSPGANQFSNIAQLNALVTGLAGITSVISGTGNTILVTADTAGTAGNSIVLARGANTAGTLSVTGSGTLSGGSAASTAPSTPAGGRLIAVPLIEDSSAKVVAETIGLVLAEDSNFATSYIPDSSSVTIIDSYTGTRTNIASGNSGMTVSTIQQGSPPPEVHIRSTGTSQVVAVIAPA
jgi:hypothetical protein